MTRYNVTIVGATGAVGQELIRILALREFPIKKITLLASKRSAGKKVESALGELTIEAFSIDKFENQDFVFFATNGDHAKEFAPHAAAKGAVVIDNSSAFRLDEDVPLVVPEVNPKAAFQHQGIIANPNCSTIQMVVALNPIHQYSRIKRIVVSTYQAVSGAGQEAITELMTQLKAVINNEPAQVEQFTKQIALNVIPHIDVFQENGYTKEEMKMVKESWKIFDDPDIKISANCVRVPVIRAHSEAINIETDSYVGEAKARALLEAAQDITVIDERENGGYPTPLEVSEKMDTYVGRIREDISCENGLALWCVADQLWKGAALNAVQIAELLVRGEQ
ncbi:aspartate-semialdehyde dehydrogenase [Aliikangiella marina]|uniref:Aspartate-semialdehyde dehydrogenase n=1 Tax=Aliikangiella marina TaxID=1712262 RepID=A0A545T2B3_9GAMM|nr:aspartate-semialdehyde dehydrogenase [Aliikangiella marina]TQV71368.1 aspartate-semialdehyde dehydrogenase [Aliikangiella marina]